MYKLIYKISYVKRINYVMITLLNNDNKVNCFQLKLRKKFFFSILNEVKVFYKRKLEKRKKRFKILLFKNLFQLIVAFSNVFRGHSNATLAEMG